MHFSKPALLKNILYRSPWKITIIIIKVHVQVGSEESHHVKELHKVKSWKRGPWGDSSVPSPKTQPKTLILWHISVSAVFQIMYRLAVRRLIMSKNYIRSSLEREAREETQSIPSPKTQPETPTLWHSSVSALFQVMYRLAVRSLIMSKNYTSEFLKERSVRRLISS